MIPLSSPTESPSPSLASPAKAGRHGDLDVLRGALLIFMAINHVPCATWKITRHPFGFMAAAEGFVLLAGLLIGLLYTRKYLRDGPRVTTPLLLRRAGKIYLAHLACIAAVIAWMGLYQAFTGSERPPVGSPWPWVEQPLVALPAALALLHQPGLLDVLPLYCGLVLLTPLVLGQLMRGRVAIVLTLSGLIWAATNLFVPQRPFVHGVVNTGAFNFGAWQLIYVCGVVAGHLGARGAWPAWLRPGRTLAVCAALGLGAGILACHGVLTLGLAPETWVAWTNKNNLAPLRLLNVACAALLLWCWLGRPRVDGTPPGGRLRCAPVARLGRHSLPVFSVHVVVALVILGLPGWFEWTGWGPWAGPPLLLGAMFATATLAERLATPRAPAPRSGA